MAARKVEKPSYAFGATMALRRETLDAIGGFLPIANYLADDYHLGHRIAQHGWRLVLSDVVVETVLELRSWRHLLQHQIRWARTYRTVRPGGYFGSILTHGTLWALLSTLYYGLGPASLAIAVGLLGLRLWCAAVMCFWYLRTDNTWLQVMLVPLKDLLVSVVWLVSFLGNAVTWSDNHFVVLRGGELLRAAPSATQWRPALIETRRSAHDSA
jgi:ceramide glucosyltransferase